MSIFRTHTDRDGNIYELTEEQVAYLEEKRKEAVQAMAEVMLRPLREGFSMGCRVGAAAPCSRCSEKNPHEHK